MQTGIIAAMSFEARILVGSRIEPGHPLSLQNGVCLVLSGVGPHRAAEAARKLIRGGASFLVSWGVAGSLSSALPSGSLILAENVIAGHGTIFKTDPVMSDQIGKALNGCCSYHRGNLAASDRVVNTDRERNRLYRSTGAVAVDMESAAIAQVAEEASVPFLAVRVILDSVQTVIPDCAIKSLDKYGRVRLIPFLLNIARNPSDARHLIALAPAYRKAKTTMTAVAPKIVQSLKLRGASRSIGQEIF